MTGDRVDGDYFVCGMRHVGGGGVAVYVTILRLIQLLLCVYVSKFGTSFLNLLQTVQPPA